MWKERQRRQREIAEKEMAKDELSQLVNMIDTIGDGEQVKSKQRSFK